VLVNLSGGAEGGELDAQLAAARPHGDRVIILLNLDGGGCCGETWVAREAARLARGKALGARGLAAGQQPPGAGLASRRGEPIWVACAALATQRPVSCDAGRSARPSRRAWNLGARRRFRTSSPVYEILPIGPIRSLEVLPPARLSRPNGVYRSDDRRLSCPSLARFTNTSLR
jgi:hypothetical protein